MTSLEPTSPPTDANRDGLGSPRARRSPATDLACRLARPCAMLAWALSASACEGRPLESLGHVPDAAASGPRIDRPAADARGPLVVAHAGQGSPAAASDGPELAAAAALAMLDAGKTARVAVIDGVRVLEDDPRFNAGTGANLRMDGVTHECDAAVMDDDGRFSAVAGIDGVRHPILVADAVAATPHRLLAGAGAQAFADGLGLTRASLTTERAREGIARAMKRLLAGQPPSGWVDFDWRARWNYPTQPPVDVESLEARWAEAPAAGGEPTPASTPRTTSATTPAEPASDTVGLVARTKDGRYAAALSTGGTALALRGRVGDVPLEGHGLFAGPHGAVAATGKGEAIVREQVARGVYELLRRGFAPEQAIRLAIRDISEEEGVGVIAVSARGWGAVATSSMAWAVATPAGIVRADTHVSR